MPEFFIGRLPDVLYHGSPDVIAAGAECRPASESSWWREIAWDDYDDGTDGGHRTAYANIVWEFLGLRDEARADVPGWAADVRDIDDLASRIGILFVTDRPEIAEGRYGHVHEIDMTSPDILDVVPDPNPGTYDAWLLLIRSGRPLPLRATPSPAMR